MPDPHSPISPQDLKQRSSPALRGPPALLCCAGKGELPAATEERETQG